MMTTLPHVKGSDTSKAAAVSMEDSAPSMRQRVLRFIAANGASGTTDDAIESALGLRHQSASARRRELVLAGFIADSGRREKTRSGRSAVLWVQTCHLEPKQEELPL
jgi:predicted transcriptional regulator